MKIRKLEARDFEGALRVWKDVTEEEPTKTRDYLPSFFKKNSEFCFVAENKNEIVGVVLGSFNGRAGYINRLAGKKDFQNQGIASKVREAVVSSMKKAEAPSIFLHCKQSLASFYGKFGFEVDQKNIIMRLKIPK